MSNEYLDWERDKIEEEKLIVEKYPFLHIRDIDGNIDTKSKFPMIPLEIPDGWYKLFFQMCDDIKPILEKEGKLYDFYFIQVKEKYNQLVCYFNDAPAAVKEIIMKYRRMAHLICTKCGKIAVYATKGYIASFCNDCFKDTARHIDGEWIEYEPYYVMITINDGSRSERVVSFEDELTRYKNTL